jgi:histidine phosphotransferase ChpT
MSVGRVSLEWEPPHVQWPKDWAKLLMNVVLIGADCLPKGGVVRVQANGEGQAPGFKVTASGATVRVSDDVERALKGEISEHDARGVQPVLAFRLAKGINAGLTITLHEGRVELVAG